MTEAAKHPGGRPLKFQSVEELETQINCYFDDCDKLEDTRVFSQDEIVTDAEKRVCTNCWKEERTRGCLLVSGRLKLPRPYTVTGLALWLDTTRRTLLDYQTKDEFSHAIMAAKLGSRIMQPNLFDKDTPTRGVIFSLSNNAEGWTEKREVTIKVPNGTAALARTLLGGGAVAKSVPAVRGFGLVGLGLNGP